MSRTSDELARLRATQRLVMIEAAIECMLTSPEPVGVLVETFPDLSFAVSLSADEEPMVITYRERDTRT